MSHNKLKNVQNWRDKVRTYCSSACTREGWILIFFKKDPRSYDLGTAVWVHVFQFWSNSSCYFPVSPQLNHVPGATIQRGQSIPKAHLAADAWLFVELLYCGLILPLPSSVLQRHPHYQTVERSIFMLFFDFHVLCCLSHISFVNWIVSVFNISPICT